MLKKHSYNKPHWLAELALQSNCAHTSYMYFCTCDHFVYAATLKKSIALRLLISLLHCITFYGNFILNGTVHMHNNQSPDHLHTHKDQSHDHLHTCRCMHMTCATQPPVHTCMHMGTMTCHTVPYMTMTSHMIPYICI